MKKFAKYEKMGAKFVNHFAYLEANRKKNSTTVFYLMYC